MNLPALLTTAEVCRYLRLHRNTVNRLVARGELRAVQVCARGDKRFRREDIEAYLEALRG